MSIKIDFGVDAMRINEQIEEQGYRYKKSQDAPLVQKMADSIGFLEEQGILRPYDALWARHRLEVQIEQRIETAPKA